jgi:hypothetical protein
MKRLLAAAAAAAAMTLYAQAQPAPAAAVDAESVQRRLASVETLIERSSGAKQVEASGVPAALERRAAARASLKRAQAAFAGGDVAGAAALLPEASKGMFEAVRLAAPEQVTSGKRRTDVEERLESARALLAAQRRIAQEKPAQGAAETTRAIERLLEQGRADLAANQVERASTSVEQGYLLAKAAIGSMRSGDTLVRSLNFGSKEEEYRYEIDRNDTHRMLLTLLLDAAKAERAQPAMQRAALLRSQAEGAAGSGDHAAAVSILEDSTRELVRAIRAAGIYIPG